jgi:hypothetical protein
LINTSKTSIVYDNADMQTPPPVVFVFSGQGSHW